MGAGRSRGTAGHPAGTPGVGKAPQVCREGKRRELPNRAKNSPVTREDGRQVRTGRPLPRRGGQQTDHDRRGSPASAAPASVPSEAKASHLSRLTHLAAPRSAAGWLVRRWGGGDQGQTARSRPSATSAAAANERSQRALGDPAPPPLTTTTPRGGRDAGLPAAP